MLVNIEAGLELLRREKPFYSSVLSQIVITETTEVPLIGLMFDKSNKKYTIGINLDTFKDISIKHVAGLFMHELLHLVHNHNFRFDEKLDKHLANLSMDLAVNQYISDGYLPDDHISMDNLGKGLEPFQAWEYYYKNLFNNSSNSKLSTIDTHEEINNDDSKEERKKIIRTAIHDKGYNTYPDFLKDEFDQYDKESALLDYKTVLKRIIRKSIIKGQNRTYSRVNKRYGQQVKGYADNKVARLHIYVDTSGSISATEIGEEIDVISNFCRITQTNITVSYFHTDIYKTQVFRAKEDVAFKTLEAGGTELTCVLKDIVKNNADLSIIVTDGYYDTKIDNVPRQVLFLITNKGNINHTLSNVGYTLEIAK